MSVSGAGAHVFLRRKSRLLFCCALLLGLLLVLLIPPFDSPDELTHFQNVWAIGHGQIFSREYWSEGRLQLPEDYAPLMSEYPVRLIGINNHEKCSWGDLFRQSLSYCPNGVMMEVHGRIFSLGYLFSAFGMALGSLLGALPGLVWLQSPYMQLLLGRMTNWGFYLLTVRSALRILQPLRRTLFLLASMPMSLFLAATLNYDAVLIPVSLWLFASVLNYAESGGGRLSSSDFAKLSFGFLFLGGVKAPYACLTLLLFILPGAAFGDRSSLSRRLGLVVLAALFGLALSTVSYLVPVGGAVGYTQEQAVWLLAHPLSLPGIILRTLQKDALTILIGFWGCFGWLDVHVPRFLTVLGWIVLLCSAALDCCSFPVSSRRRRRLPGLLSAILVYCVLCTLQYVSHAPKVNGNIIGGDVSIGFQGRYLIPVFLPFVLTFSNSRLWQKKPEILPAFERHADRASMLWGLCCWLITGVTLLLRYWV